jgi:hypothetical protein
MASNHHVTKQFLQIGLIDSYLSISLSPSLFFYRKKSKLVPVRLIYGRFRNEQIERKNIERLYKQFMIEDFEAEKGSTNLAEKCREKMKKFPG